MRPAIRYIFIGVLTVTALGMGGAAVVLPSRTFVNPWVPVACSGVFALGTGLSLGRLWEPLTRSGGRILNLICHLIFVTSVLCGAFYILNYSFPHSDTSHTEKAVVESRLTKTRYRSKRVGTRRYVRGDPYKVHFLRLGFESGKTKEMEVSLSEYNRRRSGDTVSFRVCRGLFGLPVIKNESRPQL